MASNYIRFDWAMKRLLRNKANFAVLEGFLTTFLGDQSLFRNYWRVKVIKKMSTINIIVWVTTKIVRCIELISSIFL